MLHSLHYEFDYATVKNAIRFAFLPPNSGLEYFRPPNHSLEYSRLEALDQNSEVPPASPSKANGHELGHELDLSNGNKHAVRPSGDAADSERGMEAGRCKRSREMGIALGSCMCSALPGARAYLLPTS
eukprot:3191468-Rhodomonas_salina.1